MIFSFFKKRIPGEEVDLCPMFTLEAKPENNYVTTLYYDICLHETKTVVGQCSLRVGMNEELYYLGNIGYTVFEDYRGHNYAYKACQLLFQEAKQKYKMEELIITCNPDNIPSRKTLEKLNGELIEIVPIPKDHCCYRAGDREKCIFKYKL